MTAPPFQDRLAATPLVAGIDAEARQDLLDLFTERSFAAGDHVVRAGSADRDLLLLLEGSLQVFARDGELRYPLATLGPGDLLGEVGFFDPQAWRTADVVARTPGVLAILSPDAYVDLRRRAHPAASSLETQVVRLLVARLHQADTLLAGLLDDHRAGRLALSVAALFGGPPPAEPT